MPPPNFHRLQEEMEEVRMMMMITLMVKQVQLFFKLWILCHLSIGLNASFAIGDGGGRQDDGDEDFDGEASWLVKLFFKLWILCPNLFIKNYVSQVWLAVKTRFHPRTQTIIVITL